MAYIDLINGGTQMSVLAALLVGGKFCEVTVASAAGSYVSGDLIGGKMSLTEAVRETGGTAILHSIDLCDKGGTLAAADCYLYFFNADPTNSTFTDSGALAINDADAFKVVYVHKLTSTDWKGPGGGGNSYYTQANIGKLVYSTTTTIYCALETRGTPAIANGDAQLRVGFLRN